MVYGRIYVIKFPNEKCYIGLTTTSLNKRKREHHSCASRCNKKSYIIYKALNKYDMVDTFELEEIDTAENLEELREKEKQYISSYNSHYITGNGYNMTYGGDGGIGYEYTPEARQKISEKSIS